MKPKLGALNRKAWGLFLMSAVVAAAWSALNLLAPTLTSPWVAARLGLILAVVLYGLWRGLARAEFSPTARVSAWLAVALLLTIWIAAVWTLAANGAFQQSLGKVPTVPLAIFLPILLGGFILTRSKAVGSLLDATPPSWLAAIQVYRIFGAVFFVYWIHGAMPGAFAMPAGIGDVATGLVALPAAAWVASGSPIGRRIGIRWNLLGLIDFAVAITMGMLTAPGPTHLLAREHANLQIAMFPTVMTPAFIVPFSTLLHLLSLRQLKRAQGTVTTAKQEATLVTA